MSKLIMDRISRADDALAELLAITTDPDERRRVETMRTQLISYADGLPEDE